MVKNFAVIVLGILIGFLIGFLLFKITNLKFLATIGMVVGAIFTQKVLNDYLIRKNKD
jgi:ribose/xylose/arabinose/galactoside ABC-type transport system permease subunit